MQQQHAAHVKHCCRVQLACIRWGRNAQAPSHEGLHSTRGHEGNRWHIQLMLQPERWPVKGVPQQHIPLCTWQAVNKQVCAVMQSGSQLAWSSDNVLTACMLMWACAACMPVWARALAFQGCHCRLIGMQVVCSLAGLPPYLAASLRWSAVREPDSADPDHRSCAAAAAAAALSACPSALRTCLKSPARSLG